MTYGENSNQIRVELTTLLRQHRIQHRLGGRGLHTLPETTTIEQRQAMGELIQSYRRAVPDPPNAGPFARFLLYERDYPDSVAFSVEALHAALTAAETSYRGSPAVLRVGRLLLVLRLRIGLGDAVGPGVPAWSIGRSSRDAGRARDASARSRNSAECLP